MILHIMQAKTLCEISQYPFPGFYKLVEVNENDIAHFLFKYIDTRIQL